MSEHRLKNKKDRVKSWHFPVFHNYEIKVVSSSNIKKAVKKFEHTKNISAEDLEDSHALHFWVKDEDMSYIFLPHKTTISATVHEAYHAIRRMLNVFGVDVDDNEIVAYHLGYMVQEISDWRWSWK